MLAVLCGALPGVAEAMLGLLGFDLRRKLVADGLVEPVPLRGEHAAEIVLTERGRRAIEDAASTPRTTTPRGRLIPVPV